MKRNSLSKDADYSLRNMTQLETQDYNLNRSKGRNQSSKVIATQSNS